MWEQITDMITSLIEADSYLYQKSSEDKFEDNAFLIDDMTQLIDTITAILGNTSAAAAPFNMAEYKEAVSKNISSNMFSSWVTAVMALIPSPQKNTVQLKFDNFFEKINKTSEKKLVDEMKANFNIWRKRVSKSMYNAVIDFPAHFWGEINPDKKQFKMFEERAACLKEHEKDFAWLFNQLADKRSQGVLLGILQYWLDMDTDKINQIRELQFPSYFDLDIVNCTSEEVFVDAGAYVGDTAKEYIDTFGENCYKKIYCYDIISKNLSILNENLKDYKNIQPRLAGVGSENGQMFLEIKEFDDMVANAAQLKKSGQRAVPVVRIDDDITEPITFLKMDIEGAEYDALLGARRHIMQERPKLAICLYHSNQDLWRLPRLIYSMSAGYKFYLRMYGYSTNYNDVLPFASDYVLYCIPN